MSEQGHQDTYVCVEQLSITEYEGECLENPELADWLATMPQSLNDEALIFRLRNRVYKLPDPRDSATGHLCVKVFKTPGRLRSLAYKLSGSKAQRAHANARHLHRHGAGTSEPVAYMEKWHGHQIAESYLVSGHLENATDLYTEMHSLMQKAPLASHFVALMRFTARAIRAMHDSGFVHNDLGAQNILMQQEALGQWHTPVFIDLNRGRVLPEVSLRLRAKDMARLQIPSHFLGILYQIYFDDGPVPKEFQRWETHYRNRIRLRQTSRKYRHPIRHLRHLQQIRKHGRSRNIEVSAGKLPEKDIWIWDDYSSQPSVTHKSKDRRRHRRTRDIFRVLWANLSKAPSIHQAYRRLKTNAYSRPVSMAGRLGVAVEADHTLDEQLAVLRDLPQLSVLVRCYFHTDDAARTCALDAIKQLHRQGHEVALALVQSRQAVINPDQWLAFVTDAITQVQDSIQFVEVGHAVNRVKWGFWTIDEMNRVWHGVDAIKKQHPHLTFLGPAVNDFEFHYYPPLLNANKNRIDALSCHLYVDRRGEPENYQGHFSSLEKCLAGRAIADAYGKAGFYITEINWPLEDTGLYSPLAGAYIQKNATQSHLHVTETDSAAYMIRFALIALCSGSTERIWWWRLAHPGFGLFDTAEGFNPRAGWHALVHFHNTLGQDRFERRTERDGIIWWRFTHCTIAVALSPSAARVPDNTKRITDMTGSEQPFKRDDSIPIAGEPVYFHH